jgi:ferric-dicitrate binding protein FerR (iron transport regulator)
MTQKRVAELIAAYGAAPDKWPEAERIAALAVLRRDPALQAELRQMAALDAALDRWPSPAAQVDAVALAAHVSATPRPRVVARRPFFRFPIFAWPNAAGLAAAALAGFLVGWSGLDSDYSSAQLDSVDQQIVASLVEDATW